jgi:hypothetical protein
MKHANVLVGLVGAVLANLAPASAETARRVDSEEVLQGRVCYYETPSGFTHHYLIPKGLLGTPGCAASLETPFPQTSAAILIKSDVDLEKRRICYYGRRGRVFLQVIPHAMPCRFVFVGNTQVADAAGEVPKLREDELPGSDSKVCFYAVRSNDPRMIPTHFLLRSKKGVCPPAWREASQAPRN